jgi:class 3 adenylate cyclase/YHS domain-containing protein
VNGAELHEPTFLFADLAGFTALTEAMGDETAADVVGDFCAAVRELLDDHHAEEVKTIGDALMLYAHTPARAVELGLRIVEDVGSRHYFPVVRVGMHTGEAVERAGDWFGATVNLAARVSAAGGDSEVLLTSATREAAGTLAGIELHQRGRRAFKNVAEPVEIYAAARTGAKTEAGLPIDPVCRMAVDPAHGAGQLVFDAVEYHFCSLECANAFSGDPQRYARGANDI